MQNSNNVAQARDEAQARMELRRTIWALAWAAIIGMSGVLCYALSSSTKASFIGVGITISGAAFLLGSLLGFLFGIPKTIQQVGRSEQPSQGHQNNGQHTLPQSKDLQANGAGQDNQSAPYRVNTNLEEISDWLTKILVGVGLTQLSSMPEKFWSTAGKFVEALGGTAGNTAIQAFAAVLILHFLATGFFFGYLLTRLFLTRAFQRAEQLPKDTIRYVQAMAAEVTQRTDVAVQEVAALASLIEARTVENQMFTQLYRDPPAGFKEVIRLGEAYVQGSPETVTAKLYGYLACAYGQQFIWERKNENRYEVVSQSHTKALNAVKMALEKDKTLKSWLGRFLHPSAGSEDNDLEAFQGDPEFECLLGS